MTESEGGDCAKQKRELEEMLEELGLEAIVVKFCVVHNVKNVHGLLGVNTKVHDDDANDVIYKDMRLEPEYIT